MEAEEGIILQAENLALSDLTAVSPIDGRYASSSKPLREFFSEYALIKYRVIVEIKWFEALFKEGIVGQWDEITPELSNLRAIYEQFSEKDALRVKEIEAKTNHDVKAVEYFLKEKFDLYPILKERKEYLHFTCTSEDINNLSYGMMIQRGINQ
jgi:adenylosuccinate lyase